MAHHSEVKPGKNRRGLGRGLDALLGQDLAPVAASESNDMTVAVSPEDKILHIPLERLTPNPFQPRQHFDDEALGTLARSIAQHGIMQPLVVRQASGGYQLIAGERRLRAAQMAGLTEVPAVVRQASDEQTMVLALLENLQRADLNPMEEARAFKRLEREFDFTHDDIGSAVGKDRSTISNTMRLLNLPSFLQELIAGSRLSQGHGRALLMLDNEAKMRQAVNKIMAGGLNVRATEALVKAMNKPDKAPRAAGRDEAYWQDLVERLQKHIGAKAELKRQGKKGALVLHYYSHEDLERLLKLLGL